MRVTIKRIVAGIGLTIELLGGLIALVAIFAHRTPSLEARLGYPTGPEMVVLSLMILAVGTVMVVVGCGILTISLFIRPRGWQ